MKIKIKKIIIILIIIAVILGLIILNSIKKYNKYIEEVKTQLPEQQEYKPTIIKTIHEETARDKYYIIKNCIEKFYLEYAKIYQDEKNITIKLKKQLYSLLDDEYIKYKGITIENMLSKLPKIGSMSINIDNMYCIQKNDIISIYFAYGSKRDKLSTQVTNFSIMVKIDELNKTYKILLDDYVQDKYKDIAIGQTIKINEEEIKNDEYNTYTYRHVDDFEYTKDLFEHFKNSMINNKEKSYNLIDETCFENINEYLKYLNENYLKLINTIIEDYSKNKKENYTEYIFKDTVGQNYIFKETKPFKYNLVIK